MIIKSTFSKISIAVIGYGYWGPNLVRNFYQLPDCQLAYICEQNSARREQAQRDYPSVKVSADYQQILRDPSIQGIVIATPVSTHFALAKAALLANKHIFVEKAFTRTLEEATILVKLAQQQQRQILVDHIYLYHPAVRKIKQLVDTELGNIQYIDTTRINLGLFQSDVNVIWDLGPHDISICNYLLDDQPIHVDVITRKNTPEQPVSMAYLTLEYPHNRLIHITLSWVSPVKIRQMLIGGDRKMIVFNDLESTEKVKVYDTSYEFTPPEKRHEVLVDYRIGDIAIPKIDTREALHFAALDFLDCIKNNQAPFSNGQTGVEVMRVFFFFF
ncbi:MAG: Gfo/Idh/MocA family protein, partial [Saprospiraceae bacterium]